MSINIDDDDDDDGEGARLGPCCVCESTIAVHTFIMLPKKTPTPGRGWGCVVCGLPSDGAIAVICDACARAFESVSAPPLHFACRGYPGVDGRVPIDTLAGVHEHDLSQHVEDFV